MREREKERDKLLTNKEKEIVERKFKFSLSFPRIFSRIINYLIEWKKNEKNKKGNSNSNGSSSNDAGSLSRVSITRIRETRTTACVHQTFVRLGRSFKISTIVIVNGANVVSSESVRRRRRRGWRKR